MPTLIVATLAFLGTHLVASTPLRARLVSALSERGYLACYSALALATLAWMSWAYAHAPFEPVWQSSVWRLLPLVVMPVSSLLVAAGYLTRNPGAVMQQAALRSPQPARGILRVTRHPIMWAIILWAAVHVLARGDAASLIFFGGFLLLAAAGTMLLDARKATALGAAWQSFAAVTSNIPFGAIVAGRNRLNLAEIGWTRLGAGAALYVLLFLVHPHLFGARPY